MIRFTQATVFHARHGTAANHFRYTAPYVLLPLSALAASSRKGLFGIGRPSLFSLRAEDYGDGNPAAWIHRTLMDWGVAEANGDVLLLTMPRTFGYVFNPVNFWFCLDNCGGLRALLAEVNNTFGERHSYLCFHDDRRPIAPADTLTAQKTFHVSPFLPVDGDYRFQVALAESRVAVAVDLVRGGETILRTSVAGTLEPLSNGTLVRALLANPLLPLKVMALIHYQALRLVLRGVRHWRKPAPPALPVSR